MVAQLAKAVPHQIGETPTAWQWGKLHCPITRAAIQDPAVASDGHTYERAAIEQWIHEAKLNSKAPLSPMTGELVAAFVFCNKDIPAEALA